MIKILMMSAKLATPGLLKLTIYKHKDYDVIIVDYDVTNKTLSRDSNYIVDVDKLQMQITKEHQTIMLITFCSLDRLITSLMTVALMRKNKAVKIFANIRNSYGVLEKPFHSFFHPSM